MTSMPRPAAVVFVFHTPSETERLYPGAVVALAGLEGLDAARALGGRRRAVQLVMIDSLGGQTLAHGRQAAEELGEDESAVAFGAQLVQALEQRVELGALRPGGIEHSWIDGGLAEPRDLGEDLKAGLGRVQVGGALDRLPADRLVEGSLLGIGRDAQRDLGGAEAARPAPVS